MLFLKGCILLGGLLGIITSGNFDFLTLLISIIASSIVVFLTLPIHEYAHGFVASKLGDPTPRYQGRLSLNPMHHIDYIGALMIYLIGFGWAKPVSIDSRYFKNPKVGMALTAAAGPVSNVIVAFFSCFLANTFSVIVYLAKFTGFAETLFVLIANIFFYISIINVSLAVFNLIPIPPLDGSKILAMFLPDRAYYTLMRYEQYLSIIMIILLYTTRISSLIGTAAYNCTGLFLDITFLPFKLFLN